MYTNYSKVDLDLKSAETSNVVIQTPESELVNKYDLENCVRWIKENNFQTTCLQFPNPLLNDGTSIAIYLQSVLNRVVFLLGDTAYGSCCVDEVAAKHVNGDSIIHFGHACLSPVTNLPVFYVFEKKNLSVSNLKKSLEVLNGFVVIFYSDVYHHLYLDLCNAFQDRTDVCVSKLHLSHKSKLNENEVVICGRIFRRKSSAKILPVYIGEDSITLESIVYHFSDVKVYLYTEESKLKEYDLIFKKKKFLMQRSFLVEKIKVANVIGILVGTLGIKNYLDAIERIKLLAKKKNKKCYILAVGKPNVAKLANFPEVDIFVLISCQENSLLRDFKNYYKPVVSLMEVEVALGDRPYSVEYTLDFRQLLPGGSFYKTSELDWESDSSSDMTQKLQKELNSQKLMEKNPGTLVKHAGAQFLANRSWRGLEQSFGQADVLKASKGRTGIPQTYENELETFCQDDQS